MLQALVVVPDGDGPGGADGRDLAAVLSVADGGDRTLSVTVTTPTGGPAAVDESSLAWVRHEAEDDWVYLATVGEDTKPTLAALSEGDVRALGLPVCRHLRDELLESGVSHTVVHTLVFEAVQGVRSRLAPLEEVWLKLAEGEAQLDGVDVKGCYDRARSALEEQCRQRAADVAAVVEGGGPLARPVPLGDIAPDEEWDVVLVVGGGEQVEALATNSPLGALLVAAHRRQTPVGVVGAGSAALLSVEDGPDGWIFDGTIVSAPPDASYSFLADRRWSHDSVRNHLLRRGAVVDETGPNWASRITQDRGVTSGRNSRCATAVYSTAIAQARGSR